MMSGIKERLTTLAKLQETENTIQGLERELAIVDRRIQSLDQKISDDEQRVAATQVLHAQLKKQYREGEGEIKRIEDRIVHSHEKLRSVKTNKEYQSMLKEIDELKKQQSGLEDQMLQTLEQIETGAKEVEVLEADLVDLATEIASQKAEIHSNAADQRAALEKACARRDHIMEALDLKTGNLYSKIKQQNMGIGVAGVLDAVCQACRMNIPPQLYIELMRMQNILMCPHCQRIIYPQAIIQEELADEDEQ